MWAFLLCATGINPGVAGGFESGPPNLRDPLRRHGVYLWDANHNKPSGDRMSGSLINVHQPEMFQCRVICGNDWCVARTYSIYTDADYIPTTATLLR